MSMDAMHRESFLFVLQRPRWPGQISGIELKCLRVIVVWVPNIANYCKLDRLLIVYKVSEWCTKIWPNLERNFINIIQGPVL
jgi:hypothetical protein